MPRLFESKEPISIYKKPQEEISPEELERKRRGEDIEITPRLQDIITKTRALTEKYPIELTKEPKTTVSREYVAGQKSQEEEEQQQRSKTLKKEYTNYFLTQTELGQNKKWAEMIPQMELSRLENLYEEYTEWQEQKQQEVITNFGKQLGLDATMVQQIQEAYPEEELEPRLQMAGYFMTLLKAKPSASLMKQFSEFMFPEAEEEPTMSDELSDIMKYFKLTGDPEAGGMGVPTTELPFEMTSTYDKKISGIGEYLMQGLQEEGISSVEGIVNPMGLLEDIMREFNFEETETEEAKYTINYILQEILGQTIDWDMVE